MLVLGLVWKVDVIFGRLKIYVDFLLILLQVVLHKTMSNQKQSLWISYIKFCKREFSNKNASRILAVSAFLSTTIMNVGHFCTNCKCFQHSQHQVCQKYLECKMNYCYTFQQQHTTNKSQIFHNIILDTIFVFNP